jgi:hypothetical protein
MTNFIINILILHSFSSGSRHAKAIISNGLEDLLTWPSDFLDCNKPEEWWPCHSKLEDHNIVSEKEQVRY